MIVSAQDERVLINGKCRRFALQRLNEFIQKNTDRENYRSASHHELHHELRGQTAV